MATHYRGTEAERRALDAYIALMRAAEAATARIHAGLGEKGLTIAQFGALEALYHVGPMLQGELAGKLLRSTGNVGIVVDNLEDRGLVKRERREDDRRFVTVACTEKGSALIRSIFPEHAQTITRDMSVLPPAEQEALRRLCVKLGKGRA